MEWLRVDGLPGWRALGPARRDATRRGDYPTVGKSTDLRTVWEGAKGRLRAHERDGVTGIFSRQLSVAPGASSGLRPDSPVWQEPNTHTTHLTRSPHTSHLTRRTPHVTRHTLHVDIGAGGHEPANLGAGALCSPCCARLGLTCEGAQVDARVLSLRTASLVAVAA